MPAKIQCDSESLPKQPRKRINKLPKKSPDFKAGDKYYHLTFTGQYQFLKNRWLGEFRCDCGDIVYAQTYNVWSGDKRFCSRVKHQSIHPKRAKHGAKYPFVLLLAAITASKDRMKHGCSLTCEDLITQFNKQDGKCIFTGRKLVLPNNQKDSNENMVSIDRIDSSLGYHANNIQLTIPIVNKMKFDMTSSEFISLCKEIVSQS